MIAWYVVFALLGAGCVCLALITLLKIVQVYYWIVDRLKGFKEAIKKEIKEEITPPRSSP